MTGCEQTERYLSSADGVSRRPPPEDVRVHLEKCAPCRKLWEFARAAEPAEVPCEVRSCIQQKLRSSLRPVRPVPCGKTRGFMFFAIFLTGAGLWVLQTGARGANGLSGVQLAGTLAAVAAAAALAAVVLSGEMVPGERRVAPIGLVALVAVGGLAALVALLFPWATGNSPWLAAALNCHAHGAMIAIPTAAVAFLALRRGAPLCPGTAGGAIGLLAGLAAMATLQLGCSMHDALHITAGHLSLPAGGALIGFVVGKVAGRWAENARGRSLEV